MWIMTLNGIGCLVMFGMRQVISGTEFSRKHVFFHVRNAMQLDKCHVMITAVWIQLPEA